MFFDEDGILEIFRESYLNLADIKSKICLAVSGGVDSMFLAIAAMDTLQKSRADFNEILSCLIVDHDLRSDSASQALDAKRYLNKMGFRNVRIIKWNHEVISSGIEEKARDARYSIIADFCRENDIKQVATGQHKDDQIETFFLNLLRGSGTVGLGCMQEKSGKYGYTLLRPMLDIGKNEIIRFMQNNNITWFEDPTNQSDVFTRNKVRKIIAALDINTEFGDRIVSSIRAIQGVNEVMDRIVDGYLEGGDCEVGHGMISVNTRSFQGLHFQEQVHTIYRIYRLLGGKKPRFDQLQDVIYLIDSVDTTATVPPRKLYLAESAITISPGRIVFSKVN